MPMRFRIVGIVMIALACLTIVYGGVDWAKTKLARHHLQHADRLEVSQADHGSKAVTHEQEAESFKAVLQGDAAREGTDDAAVARSRAEVARLCTPGPRLDPSAAPGAVPSQLLQTPVDVVALDVAKDRLIDDLTRDLTDTKKTVADQRAALEAMTLADLERRAQVRNLQGEVLQLRASDSARPRERRWAVGATYSTDGSAGGWVERNLGPVRIGVDVVRRITPGRQSTLEAVGRIGWSF